MPTAGQRVLDELRAGWAARVGADELERIRSALAAVGVRVPDRLDAPDWLDAS